MHDHRQLGRELGLFGGDPLIGAGLPYWLPAGAAVRHAENGSCTSFPGTGRTTATTCSRRWNSARSRWCCGRACARTTR